MRKVLLALVALVFGVAFFTGSAKTINGIARFREVEVAHVYASPGESWRTRVFLFHSPKLVGTGAFACMHVDRNTSIRECSGTYILPQGRIQLAGSIVKRASFLLLIVGGSGIYAGASGTAIVSQIASSPRQAFLTFYFS